MALSDCYMLRDVQMFGSELVLNVFFYQDLLLASTAQNVVESYVADVIPVVTTIQSSFVHHTLIDCVNLDDPANFYELVLDEAGQSGGDSLPAHSAISFGLRLNSRALRPGSKRICGVPESAQVNGEVTNTGYLENMELYRIQLHTILQSGVLATFQPIVVKRIPYTVTGSDPARTAYRLPENDGELVFGNVVEALTTPHVSHQVSRGNGR